MSLVYLPELVLNGKFKWVALVTLFLFKILITVLTELISLMTYEKSPSIGSAVQDDISDLHSYLVQTLHTTMGVGNGI
jgi:hypothetical protein